MINNAFVLNCLKATQYLVLQSFDIFFSNELIHLIGPMFSCFNSIVDTLRDFFFNILL